MALSEDERRILRAFFNYFPDDELMSLALTVTQNKIVVSRREDAIDAILNFSPSTESILKRRKVKTEYMVKFMHDCNISMHEKIEKPAVMRRFLNNLPARTLPPAREPPTQEPSAAEPPAAEPPSSADSNFGAAFAGQFTPWFVDLFNGGPPGLGPQHFWPDAELRLRLLPSDGAAPRDVMAEGAEAIAAELLALHGAGTRLVASPNGASAQMDSFGRVTLQLRGVVHRMAAHGGDGGPAGLFQLALGLMEEVPSADLRPEQRAYKIKFVHAELGMDTELITRAIAS